MNIAFTIPKWILWTLGFGSAVVVVALLIVGVLALLFMLEFMRNPTQI